MVPNSTSGSDEEEEEEDEEDVGQSNDGQSGTLFESTSTAAIFSMFTEMSSQFAEMMELHRKQHLMARKSARALLPCYSPPPVKSCKLKSPFSPKRSAAYLIGSTQANEDFECDFLASQSSRTTARIRLQEKFVEVATLFKDEFSPNEIKEHIRDIAFNAMAKSVVNEDIDPADRTYGG